MWNLETLAGLLKDIPGDLYLPLSWRVLLEPCHLQVVQMLIITGFPYNRKPKRLDMVIQLSAEQTLCSHLPPWHGTRRRQCTMPLLEVGYRCQEAGGQLVLVRG